MVFLSVIRLTPAGQLMGGRTAVWLVEGERGGNQSLLLFHLYSVITGGYLASPPHLPPAP